jgi:hypothetical protein
MASGDGEFERWYSDQIEFEEARKRKTKKKDLVQALLADLEEEPAPRTELPSEAFITDRLRAARQTKDQLRREMDLRVKMHRHFLKEIKSQITYAQFSLEKFSGWGVGYNTGVDVKRNHLERILLQLRNERRASVLKTWEDLVRIRKDLREAWQEYHDSRRLDEINRE